MSKTSPWGLGSRKVDYSMVVVSPGRWLGEKRQWREEEEEEEEEEKPTEGHQGPTNHTREGRSGEGRGQKHSHGGSPKPRLRHSFL